MRVEPYKFLRLCVGDVRERGVDYIDRIDSRFVDRGTHVLDVHKTRGTYVTLLSNDIVNGRSWEMASVLACDEATPVSGEVINVRDGVIYFGPVVGIEYKRRLGAVLSWEDIKSTVM